MFSIIAHGGAGEHKNPKKAKKGIKKAIEVGKKTLAKEKSALNAVEDTIKVLEDLKQFNAGKGSVLGLNGEIEMDASIATSERKIGAVTNIKDIKNPISLSRYVLEETKHVFIGGEGINELAEKKDFEKRNPYTKKRIKQRKSELKELEEKKHNLPKDTVGAVAIDDEKRLVAGTSTGGKSLKLKGRIGDSPILGAGTYANKKTALSATGNGEAIIKTMLTKEAALLRENNGLKKSLIKAINKLERIEPKNNSCGIIAIDKDQELSYKNNTKHMPVAYSKKNQEIKVTI